MKKFHSTSLIIILVVISLIFGCESQPQKSSQSDAKGKTEFGETQKMAVTKGKVAEGEQGEKDLKPKASLSSVVGGFQDIQFGTPFKEVQKTFKKKYPGPKPTTYLASKKFGKTLKSNFFQVGGREYFLDLKFDHKDRFYGFIIRTWGHHADEFQLMYRSADFLVEMFKNKYGEPARCYEKPSILEIRPEDIKVLCEWNIEGLEIIVGFECRGYLYTATGRVTNRMMEKEFSEYIDNTYKQDAIKGAKQF